jgi:hypothetical protein
LKYFIARSELLHPENLQSQDKTGNVTMLENEILDFGNYAVLRHCWMFPRQKPAFVD